MYNMIPITLIEKEMKPAADETSLSIEETKWVLIFIIII